MLKEKIKHKKNGILLYGLTPPKQEYPNEKIFEISQKQIQRIKCLPIDGLVLYDIQDEVSRNNVTRPFPFLPTIDPYQYSAHFLNELTIPKIIYKCIGKYSQSEFSTWLQNFSNNDNCSVFVGAASKSQTVSLSVKQAYDLRNCINKDITLGGVTIPERHTTKKDEHIRIFDKISNGCQFFISQAVYNVNASKDLISDVYYHSVENKYDLVPMIFTLTPCGSLKTMDFMEWLGISIPKWMKNDLKFSKDILQSSIDICYRICEELVDFCLEKSIPVGFNIESVSIRKVEIDASVQLLNKIHDLLNVKFK